MWFTCTHKPDSIIILDTKDRSKIEGCMAIEFRKDGKIGMFQAIDSILGYKEIKDGDYIQSFFDTFAKNRVGFIKAKELKEHNEKKEELKGLLIELGVLSNS